MSTNVNLIGIGLYTAAEAARLLRAPVQSVRRWMAGYGYSSGGGPRWIEPLWTPQIPRLDASSNLAFVT